MPLPKNIKTRTQTGPAPENTENFKIVLMLTPSDVRACARVLEADHAGTGFDIEDSERRDKLLTRVIGQSAVMFAVRSPEIDNVITRDYAQFNKSRRMPRSHRTAGPGQ